MRCQRCASERLATVQSHASDMHDVQIGERESASYYLPYDLGIGGGDDLRMTYCLRCGQIQGNFPLPLCALEIAQTETETESELDRLRRENAALTKLYGVAACLRQHPVPFDDHFALVGAVDACRQVLEPPIDEDDER
jgi:hypothetical protein